MLGYLTTAYQLQRFCGSESDLNSEVRFQAGGGKGFVFFFLSLPPRPDQLWDLRGCIQKFPDWPPGARTANDTALCHWMQLYRYFVS
jgi:hypothetical protein